MKIIPFYLIISFFLTVFVLYMTYPEPKVLLVTPNINDKESNVYRDNNDVCYKYRREEIKCADSNIAWAD